MFTLVVFIIALVLVIFLFIMKSLEIYYGKKILLEELIEKFDAHILRIWSKIKFWWSHVNFKNTSLVIAWTVLNIRKIVIAFKRRFDHKQSHFFTKREHPSSKNRGSVSFHLKQVSDYKKTLREEGIDDIKNN